MAIILLSFVSIAIRVRRSSMECWNPGYMDVSEASCSLKLFAYHVLAFEHAASMGPAQGIFAAHVLWASVRSSITQWVSNSLVGSNWRANRQQSAPPLLSTVHWLG